MDLETLWYEAFPYVCGVGGIASLWIGSQSTLLKVSGVLLVAASLTIIRLRWLARRAAFDRMPPAAIAAKSAVNAPFDDTI